jgi:hypothetical protein
MNKKEIYLSFLLLAVAFVVLLLTLLPYRPDVKITGAPPSPPPPSVTPKPSLSPVIILSPDISKPLKSPQKIIGLVDKTWVFEGSFPLELFDNQYRSLFKGNAAAPNWLDEDSKYTNFSATLKFITKKQSGFLMIKNDNPSGLPQNDKSLTIPVVFSQ